MDPLCATILKEESLEASALKTDDRKAPGPRMFCAASPRVAWAVRVDPLDAGRTVRQTILFAGTDGARAREVDDDRQRRVAAGARPAHGHVRLRR